MTKHKIHVISNQTIYTTIAERQNNIKLELIDSVAYDKSRNFNRYINGIIKDLYDKKEINQIILVLSFRYRPILDIRIALEIFTLIFTPKQLMTNLIIIFVASDYEKKMFLPIDLKKEAKAEIYKFFKIPPEFKIPDIPIYSINTEILEEGEKRFFDENSQKAINDLIEELKIRMNSKFYSIIDTTLLTLDEKIMNEKVDKEKSSIMKEIEELKNNEDKKRNLILELKNEEEKLKNFLNNRESKNENRDIIGEGIINFGSSLLNAAENGCQIY